ncbi:hypothetical protein J3R83DRAFT_10488 [Lanmaoa asiatica]|nr:hypothetical protein J3R83DRAFT_10488 [Lanmaoa asiatica]
MLPFALKVTWFCLSFTGLIACWIVHYMFSRVTGSYWGPVLYCVFATLLEGIFCLGMVHEMDPFRMPKAFCIGERVDLPAQPPVEPYDAVQTFVIYYSAWSLTGVSAAFTFATSSVVLWPPPVKRSAASILAWKNKYCFPIIVFPLACLSISLPVLLSVNAIEPTDDLHCDASHPEWGRFLGYAGFSMILTIPCLFLSAAAAHQVLRLHRNNQHSHYTFTNSNSRIVTSGSPVSTAISSDHTTSASADHEMLHSTQSTDTGVDVRDAALYDEPDVSPSPSSGTSSSSDKQFEAWEVMGTIEEDYEFDTPRAIRGMTLPSTTGVVPPPKPSLVPVIWQLILFQMVFFTTQCLAALSTIIDVAQHLPTPTPFGSQHIALVLVGWGPVAIFGHLPAIRRQLMFWKK